MDAHKLDLVHLAIRSGVLGHIRWKAAAEQLVREDPAMIVARVTPAEIRKLLRQFVLAGNSLDVRSETRAEYLEESPDDPYWYRAVVPFAGFPKGLFVEVKLADEDPVEPWIEIVSAHPQRS